MKPGSIYVESDEEIISRSIEGQFEKLEETLTERVENRHAHLTEVDIDAHDFSSHPSTEAVADKTASPIADRPQDAEEKVVQTGDASEAEDISHQKEASDLSQTDTAETEEPEPEKESLEAEYPLTEADTDESE